MFALVFFLIFGLTEEARGMYRLAFFAFIRVFRYERDVQPEKSAIAFGSFQANPGCTDISSISSQTGSNTSVLEALSEVEKTGATETDPEMKSRTTSTVRKFEDSA